MNIPYVMRRCSKCGRWLVASTVNFNRSKSCKYGLRSECKECVSKYHKRYREANKEKVAERHKQYRENNKDKILEYHKQYRKTNKDKIAEYHKQYYQNNRDKVLEQSKQYYEANKDKVSERHKQWNRNNKEKLAEHSKQYYEANKEKRAKQCKQWSRNNKDKVAKIKRRYRQSLQGQVASFNECQRRRIKEEQQGSGITKDQWLEMMSFFDWKCAYSGDTLTKDTRSIDHIVPLNSNGDNMIWNCVPMLRSLNSSKNDKDMEKWYKEQSFYSEARLAKIYEWQEYAFNKWGKDTEYFNTNDIQIKLI